MGWKLLGGFMVIDGLLLTLFGRRFLRAVNFDFLPRAYNRFMCWQIELPEWLMRGAGAVESSLGILVLKNRS